MIFKTILKALVMYAAVCECEVESTLELQYCLTLWIDANTGQN